MYCIDIQQDRTMGFFESQIIWGEQIQFLNSSVELKNIARAINNVLLCCSQVIWQRSNCNGSCKAEILAILAILTFIHLIQFYCFMVHSYFSEAWVALFVLVCLSVSLWGIGDTRPNLHFHMKAYKPYGDQVSSRINRYLLILTWFQKSTKHSCPILTHYTASSTRNAQLSQHDLA